MDVALVVPSIRPASLRVWLEKWRPVFERHRGRLLLVVFETHGKARDAKTWRALVPDGVEFAHFTQRDVDREWRDDAWILPVTNSSCRCFGMWQAARLGAEIVVTQDDDAYPVVDVLEHHYDSVTRGRVYLDWWPIAPVEGNPEIAFPTRGMPYGVRGAGVVKFNQGLWLGIPDVDAITQLWRADLSCARLTESQAIPRGSFFPMSWMNAAFHRDVLPAVCPPPSIMDKPTDRFDDTWTGICMKRVMDELGWAAVYGPPYVRHVRATDALTNLAVEARGLALNEVFWRYVRDAPLNSDNVFGFSYQLARHLTKHPESEYVRSVGESRLVWVDKWREAFGLS